MRVEEAQRLWHPETVYLNTASYGVALPEAEERLHGTRVMAAARAGLHRTSWHVYNTDADVDELLELLNRAPARRAGEAG